MGYVIVLTIISILFIVNGVAVICNGERDRQEIQRRLAALLPAHPNWK